MLLTLAARNILSLIKSSLRTPVLAVPLFQLLPGVPQQTWAAAAGTSTTLAVTSGGSSATTVASGAVVALTATVNEGSTPVTAGQVNFCDAAAKYCADIFLLGTAQLTSAGTAQMKFRPGAGSYSYKAVFAGAANLASSASGASPLTVTITGKHPAKTELAAQIHGSRYTLTATVASDGSPIPPTGRVTFIDTTNGDKVLGTAELATSTARATWTVSETPATDQQPQSIAAADFNNDGIVDLAVANLFGPAGQGTPTGGSVTILLGNGDGSFATGPSLQTGKYPTFLRAASFKGDENADLVVSNGLNNGVLTTFLGQGDGTFKQGQSLPLPGAPAGIAIGSFSGAGSLDLAAVSGGTAGAVTSFLQTAPGVFDSTGVTSPAGETPDDAAAMTFGIVMTNYDANGTVSVLSSNGNGSFTAKPSVPVGSGPIGVAVADFNGDGKADLAVANENDNTVTILLGDGAGSFTTEAAIPVGQGPFGIAAGDFNQDGKVDLAVSNKIDNTVTVLEGNGDGTFSTAATLKAVNSPAFLVAADFNGDGVPDIAVANTSSNTVTVLLTDLTETAAATVSGIALTGAGKHEIEASYSGDSNYASSVSSEIALRPIVPTPRFTPAAGTYHKIETVMIADAMPGAKIHYALHGDTPTASSSVYTQPIKVIAKETIEAVATASGYTNSAIAKAIYFIDLPLAATPVFSPAGGAYTSDQKVAITCATADATIYYTTDDSVPTAASTKYTGKIPVSGRETIQAIAVANDHKPSKVATASYAITLQAATPVFHPGSGSYSKAQQVTIADASTAAQIYYTADGTMPTTQSMTYTGPITVPVSPQIQTLKAIAAGTGFTPSEVAKAAYTITPLVATPVFFPAAGTYSSPVSVTISDSTAKSSIYYTTDGTPPTPASKKYSRAISVSATETLRAIAIAGGQQSDIGSAAYTINASVAAPPVVSTIPAQNSAVVVSLSTATPGATIYYTLDNSSPTTSSTVYLAPFLVSSPLIVSAVAVLPGYSNSPITIQSFNMKIASGVLVWSDEFTNKTGANAQPNPLVWTYDTGNGGFGNSELENYCAWGSNASPCGTSAPNAYVGDDGYLHIVARQPSPGVYTSARLKTQGLFSFRYGRMEVRAMVPEAQGFWPAAWLLGNNIATVNWPACGEQDDLERVNAATVPDRNEGSVHGTGFTGGNIGVRYNFPAGQTAAQWHTYGMIWSKGKVQYYIDDPTKPYASFTPASLDSLPGAVWPFDAGQSNFILLNLAVGGDYPGPPDSSTPFPSEYLIDYVRVYAN